MNKQQYEVNNLPTQIVIGHQTETGVMSIYFDCTSWLASWPDLVLGVWVTQPGGTAAYPAATHMEGDVLVWDVTDSDTAVPGTGTMEIVGIASGKKKLSAITKTLIQRTTTGTATEPPEGAKAWVDSVMQAANDAETSKSQAATYAQNAAASAEKAEENAKSVTWETLSGKPSTFPPDSHTHTLESLGAASAESVSALKDDKLDKTGTAADSSKLGGKTLVEIMLAFYPVGAVYISANSTSPASLFGGTWESIGGRFLLGADSTYTAGSKGGEATHTLTIDEMPSHRHAIYMSDESSTGEFWGPNSVTAQSKLKSNSTDTTGDNQPHNNMPPYLAVYMWKRVS